MAGYEVRRCLFVASAPPEGATYTPTLFGSWLPAAHLEGVTIAHYCLLHDSLWGQAIEICRKDRLHDGW